VTSPQQDYEHYETLKETRIHVLNRKVDGRKQILSEKDVYGKAKKEMRFSERILAAIPGFRGYKEKELRRESDRLIRDQLYERLSKAKSDVRYIFRELSDHRAFEALTDMDRLVARFDRVSEKVNHAAYGYAGFFDVVKIDEEKLDRMINFDNQLIGDVGKIVEAVAAFKSEVNRQDLVNAKERVRSLSETLQSFEDAFDKRKEVIMGVV
jgi:thiamine pyrophosphate-dependent acetolactate synthase large subunit-like protein